MRIIIEERWLKLPKAPGGEGGDAEGVVEERLGAGQGRRRRGGDQRCRGTAPQGTR